MQIKINGNAELVPDKATVQDVLATKKLPEAGTVVVLNDEIIRAEQWEEVVLNGGDQLEFVRIIGGG
ncbi:MAG: sulfur carrier protein ThiS [Chloroflexi bacterium]|nr:sulfur carrier protein ThiS [Chloroflexota bacterium]